MLKTAIITGASRGIGAAAARLLAENDFAVVINFNNSSHEAERLESELRGGGLEALRFKADVSKPKQAKALAEFALANYGGIDLLVNNAGVALKKLVQDVTDEEYDRVFDVNVRGTFNMCRETVPHMVARKSGSIINIGSMYGKIGGSCESVYSASKGAVAALTKALAKELGPSGVTVNCVEPGFIATDMNSNLSPGEAAEIAGETPLGRAGTPLDVAKLILYLANDRFMTGQELGADGGLAI